MIEPTTLQKLDRHIDTMIQHHAETTGQIEALEQEISTLRSTMEQKDQEINRLHEANAQKDQEIEAIVHKIETMLV